jgi:hypothetical protein
VTKIFTGKSPHPKNPQISNIWKKIKKLRKWGVLWKKVNHRSFRKVFRLFKNFFWCTLITNWTLNLSGSFVGVFWV